MQWYGEVMEREYNPSQALGTERRPRVEDVTVYQIPDMRHTVETVDDVDTPDALDALTKLTLLTTIPIEQNPRHNGRVEAQGTPQDEIETPVQTSEAIDHATLAEMSAQEATKAHAAEELLKKKEVDRLAQEAFNLAA